MCRIVRRALAVGAGCVAAVMVLAGAQALAETGGTTSTPPAQTATSLAIEPQSASQSALDALASGGVIDTAADPTVALDSIATREQLAVYIARALKLPASPALAFDDVGAAYWGYSEIGAVSDAGIMQGTSATAFSPYAPVSRQEAAAVVLAALKYAATLDGGEAPAMIESSSTDSWLAGFQDRNFVDPQYKAAVATALSLGLFDMPTGGWLLPKLTLTFQELVGLVDRSLVEQADTPTATLTSIGYVAAADAYPKLSRGSKGDLVLLLQQRLNSMSYYCGAPDGKYSAHTRDAVYAFEKYQRLKRTGAMEATDWDALWTASTPVPVYQSGPEKRVEADLTRQILMLIEDNKVVMTVHVSTGKFGTPVNYWHIRTQSHGWRLCSLGPIYSPCYFSPRDAIHGYPSVPTYPASHGCIRTPIWIQDKIVDTLVMGEVVHVFYNKAPAAAGSKAKAS